MAIELPRRKPPSELFVSSDAIAFKKIQEGFIPYAYDDMDPAWPRRPIKPGDTVRGTLTIGYGRAHSVKPGDTCTLAQAEQWLIEDAERHADIVRSEITVPLTQGEFDAYSDVAFNLGKIPHSIKACLNGGVTDKDVVMPPGSYRAAIEQLPRNCRSKGKPLDHLFRRRLANAMTALGLPWENACSSGIVKLVHGPAPNYNIDWSETTTLEETEQRALREVQAKPQPRLAPNMAEVVSQPWLKPTPVVAERKAEPTVNDVPSVPAEFRREAADSPGQVAPTSPVAVPPPVPKAEAPPVVVPAPAPKVEPVAAEKPKPEPEKPKEPPKPIVIAAKTVDLKAIPYGEIDPANGAKNMTDSRRFVGMLIVAGGSLAQVLAAREVITSTYMAVFYDLSRDPVIVALAAGACIWLAGEIARRAGKKTITTGMVEAKELLK